MWSSKAKSEFLCYIQRMKGLKDDFHATYDVWSTQKTFFVLHTTYKTPKKKKTRYIQRIKHLKGEISYIVWSIKKGILVLQTMYEALKKRKNMLLSDSERANREKHASEWLRKSKKRKSMLLSDSERANGEKTRFWATQKEQIEKKYASERLRKSK